MSTKIVRTPGTLAEALAPLIQFAESTGNDPALLCRRIAQAFDAREFTSIDFDAEIRSAWSAVDAGRED